MKRISIIVLFVVLLAGNWSKAYAVKTFSEKDISSTAALWDSGTTEDKIEVIDALIKKYANAGTIIRKEPEFYVEEIERVRADSTENYIKPVGEVFQAIAVMYRDFDNGEDPDVLIQQVLSEEEYEFYLQYNESKMLEDLYNEWKASRAKLEQ